MNMELFLLDLDDLSTLFKRFDLKYIRTNLNKVCTYGYQTQGNYTEFFYCAKNLNDVIDILDKTYAEYCTDKGINVFYKQELKELRAINNYSNNHTKKTDKKELKTFCNRLLKVLPVTHMEYTCEC